MTPQLRELLTRIPPSPETDELQDLLTSMEKQREEVLRERAQTVNLLMRIYRETAGTNTLSDEAFRDLRDMLEPHILRVGLSELQTFNLKGNDAP